MSIWNAIFFGLVQGLTEYFPVSSAAHLSVLGNLFGVMDNGYNFQMFTVFTHFGTILAVLISFWKDITDMVYQIVLMRNRTNPRKRYSSVRLLYMVIISSLPLLLLVPFTDSINVLYYNNIIIGVMLILNGTALFISQKIEGGSKCETNMTLTDALVIGVSQIVGAIPGISRVGVAMSGGTAVGLKKDFALKYAYLLSVPAALGVNLIHLIDSTAMGFEWSFLPSFLVGMVISMLTGIAAIRIMLNLMKNKIIGGFAYYSWVAGFLFIILTMIF